MTCRSAAAPRPVWPGRSFHGHRPVRQPNMRQHHAACCPGPPRCADRKTMHARRSCVCILVQREWTAVTSSRARMSAAQLTFDQHIHFRADCKLKQNKHNYSWIQTAIHSVGRCLSAKLPACRFIAYRVEGMNQSKRIAKRKRYYQLEASSAVVQRGWVVYGRLERCSARLRLSADCAVYIYSTREYDYLTRFLLYDLSPTLTMLSAISFSDH